MKVGVCIPVKDDASGLGRTLTALAAVERGVHDVEIVVAVDGPDRHLASLAGGLGASVVVLPRHRGSYAARNAAIEALPDDVDAVLFTDAGCVPSRKWLLGHLDALDEAPIAGGAIRRILSRRPTPAEYVDAVRNLTQRAYVENDGFAVTANLAVRRAVLDQVRFDPNLQSGGDRDFCHRARALGFGLVYAPAAEIGHDCRRTVDAVVAKAQRTGAGVAALPPASQPARLPVPRLQLGLARRAYHDHGVRNPVWLAGVALADRARTRGFVSAARGAGWRPRPADLDVVVLLGTRFAALEDIPTRWRRVVEIWAADDRVARLSVVEFPGAHRRAAVRRTGELVTPTPSWHPSIRAFHATVPCAPGAGRIEAGIAFRRTARAIERAIGAGGGSRLVVAASPLWAPIALHLDADWKLFDAVDDQRTLPSLQPRRRWVERGYAVTRHFGAVTANSASLAGDLDAVAVTNAVDVEPYQHAVPAPPARVAGRRYAVYVGVIQERVDLDILEAVATRLAPQHAVVVAGPADAAMARRLRAIPGLVHLGPVPAADVPGLLAGATVGIVPHRVDALTASMDPLKVLEYVASGLPVVATPVSLPSATRNLVTVAESAEGFSSAVRRLLDAPPPRHDGSAVAGRGWHDVAESLLDIATGVHS